MKVQAVVFDWAGTTVDYGSFAPLAAFREVFASKGLDVTAEQARKPMGLLKHDHIKVMCGMDEIARQWRAIYGRLPDNDDINGLYREFEPMLFGILRDYAEPVPGAVELVAELKQAGVRIGSTTGYTRDMIDVVAAIARAKGYAPDAIVAATDVPAGRPHPYMCFLNAIQLGVYPLYATIKVGDTIADIQEGLNAGMWSVGVVKGGSELGLTEVEVGSMDAGLLAAKMRAVRERFFAAGAHFVINQLGDLTEVVEQVNERLCRGDLPYGSR